MSSPLCGIWGKERRRAGRLCRFAVGLVLIALTTGCSTDSRDSSDTRTYPSDTGTFPIDPPITPTDANPVLTAPAIGFMSPLRVGLTPQGWLLVSDPKRKVVHLVDPGTLRTTRSLRLEGKPLGVGMLGAEIYVGDEAAQAVEIFSHTGAQQGFLARPGTVAYPSDLDFDADLGLAFVLDGIAREVKVFDIADRTLSLTIGGGQLLAPTGVVVDPSRGEVLVSDYGSPSQRASVKVFSYAAGTAGELVATITAGSCNFMGCVGGFSRPRGLAVHNERILLTDALLGQVLIFDRNTLQKIGELGSTDPAARDLRLPSDIAINVLGDVFVTSTLSKSVVVFRGGAL